MYSVHYTFQQPTNRAPAEAEAKFADCKGGFPHSEITGSKGARASPVLIAACHVLHRLSTPRHPLEALMRLIVLSKTHACLITASTRAKATHLTAQASVSFYLSDYDVFSGPTWPNTPKLGAPRQDPSFTMSKHDQPKPACNSVISIAR